MLCGIWYHLYNFEKVKNTSGGVLLLGCNITKSNTSPWTFFKLYKWYQIAQSITYPVWSLWTCSCNGAFSCNS